MRRSSSGTRCSISWAIFRCWAGRFVAHIVAVKPSHAVNCELARQIVAQIRKPLVRGPDLCPAAVAAHEDLAGTDSHATTRPGEIVDPSAMAARWTSRQSCRCCRTATRS